MPKLIPSRDTQNPPRTDELPAIQPFSEIEKWVDGFPTGVMTEALAKDEGFYQGYRLSHHPKPDENGITVSIHAKVHVSLVVIHTDKDGNTLAQQRGDDWYP